MRREIIKIIAAFFLIKMEQTGIVFGIRFLKQFKEPLVNIWFPFCSAIRRPYVSMPRSSQILKKMMPVDGLLDGKIQFPLEKIRVSQGDVSGQKLPPALNLRQKGGVHLGGAPLVFVGIDIFVKRAF